MNINNAGQSIASKTTGHNKDVWSVQNKGNLVKGEQKLTYEKLSKGQSLDPKQDAALKKACQDFESFFLYYLLKQLRSSSPQDSDVFGSSRAKEIYQDMFDEQVADKVAKTRGMGLAQMLYDNVKKTLVQIDMNPSK